MNTCHCPHCGQPMPSGRTMTISTAGLTPKQAELYRFLDARDRAGQTPSYDEMAAHLGIRSKSGIHRLIDELEERGRIRRGPGRVRNITVVRKQVTA
jgi:SOS-response transcriptional repressor LexA